ncbi:hypothetical protein C5S36_08375 [Candidatus Methanophagaceae archaeon]|nr:hypothetical protein C5S36_08375 [Methanophagales archaeon]
MSFTLPNSPVCLIISALLPFRFLNSGILSGTIDFSSEITIPPNFTAERAENAETLEKPSGVLNTLKLCALCDLRVDKSLVFSIVPPQQVKSEKRRSHIKKEVQS